jgi:hypothetical protein
MLQLVAGLLVGVAIGVVLMAGLVVSGRKPH